MVPEYNRLQNYWLDFLSASQIKTIYLLVVIKILDGKEQPSKMYQAP